MRRVSLCMLEPGMKVARSIYANKGEALLKAGVTLSTGYIKRLEKLGIPFVYIDDGLLPAINIEDVVTQKTRQAAAQQVKNILLETKESGSLVINPVSIYEAVQNFTGELLSCASLMLNLVDLRDQDNYTFAHSVNVCVLAMMTGISLHFTRDQLTDLGVGALLHDLGKVLIPEHILNKPDKLTPEEFSVMKEHTTYGYNLIRSGKGLEEIHALIAYQHHESYDGSGYPLGIKQDDFQDYAQIIAIADKFDALTSDRIYRKAFPPHEAYEMCAASGNFIVKEHIAKAFLKNIAAYPSGSLVALNNGLIGMVIDTPQGYSLFPRVLVLYDGDCRPIPQEEIDLSKEDDICVIRVFSEQEIKTILRH